MPRSFRERPVRFSAALLLVAGLAWLYHALIHVNNTTVALSFLLAILVLAAAWGMAEAVAAAVAAVLAFNYFFLPPVGTLTVADPQNWIALAAFLIVAVVSSKLSARARQQAQQASRGRREAEMLYSFCQLLLGEGNAAQLRNAIPHHLVAAFGLESAALYIIEADTIYRSHGAVGGLTPERLRAAATREEASISGDGVALVPVRIGLRPEASAGLAGSRLARTTLEALGSLLALALQRGQMLEQLARAEAARESERLKSALLDSIAHDFRTPLTAIRAAATGLLSGAVGENERQEMLQVIEQEGERLNRLVAEAAEMARLEAHLLELHYAAHPVEEIVRAALAQCASFLNGREVRLRLAPALPPVRADLARAKEILVRLLENADQYSPRDRPITLAAEPAGEFVQISVADQGEGIEEIEQGLIFDKFYRGKDQRETSVGTGMGLPIARAIAELHGGRMALVSQRHHGSVFSFTLPAVRSQTEAA